MDNYEIVTTKNGKWIAYRLVSPYFCFVADTMDELKEKINRASMFVDEATRKEVRRYG